MYFMLFGSNILYMYAIPMLILKSSLAKDNVCYSHQNTIYIILDKLTLLVRAASELPFKASILDSR